MENPIESKAMKQYLKHLEHMKNYAKKHPEKFRGKHQKKSWEKLKSDPDRYALYLEKKRNKYKQKKEEQQKTTTD